MTRETVVTDTSAARATSRIVVFSGIAGSAVERAGPPGVDAACEVLLAGGRRGGERESRGRLPWAALLERDDETADERVPGADRVLHPHLRCRQEDRAAPRLARRRCRAAAAGAHDRLTGSADDEILRGSLCTGRDVVPRGLDLLHERA